MAAISEFKMAATLLDMQFSMIDRCRWPCQLSLRKLLYLHFVQMTVIFNSRFFSVSLGIPRYLFTYHGSCRLRIAGPITFAKWVHSRSALKQLQFPLQVLAYLHDRQATSAIGNVIHFGI